MRAGGPQLTGVKMWPLAPVGKMRIHANFKAVLRAKNAVSKRKRQMTTKKLWLVGCVFCAVVLLASRSRAAAPERLAAGHSQFGHLSYEPFRIESQRLMKSSATTAQSSIVVGSKVDLAFTALDGRKVDATSIAGKVTVLHFWASW
jgi:hypothetical protein